VDGLDYAPGIAIQDITAVEEHIEVVCPHCGKEGHVRTTSKQCDKNPKKLALAMQSSNIEGMYNRYGRIL